MTVLQSLVVKCLMLAVAVGILYWALQQGGDPGHDRLAATATPAAETQAPVQGDARAGDPHASDDPEIEAADPSGVNELPAPVVSPSPSDSAPRSSRSVPARAAPPPSPSKYAGARPVTFPLDLNAARIEDFMALPGIGETLARRLVEYRKRHGGFRSVEELREVRGIGEKRMEQLRPLVKTITAHE
jgi:competence ComEA-like helix-hairpin-helix protein